MQVEIFENYEVLSAYAANEIAAAIRLNPRLCLCMASGHTPARTCELLVNKLKEEKIDHSSVFFIGLDEWAGLSPDNEGSCHYFFRTKLFEPLNLSPSQYHLFDALAADLGDECHKMNELIKEKGIDLMLVGIGMNGHIGFNEPGTPFQSACHVAELDEVTRSVGQKYFSEQMTLTQGITTGLGHLFAAKKVYLMANGLKKAAVIKETIEGTVTENFPASILQQHKNGVVLADQAAASLLNKSR
ncbi:MAG: glucosamine-6-phosphate deaminase [Ferruginibacter sp.]